MRFDRIRLSNFKCYGDADLRLNAGITVIHGLNGSGKSSLLEACFFALYGSRALDTTLGEVVTIGADKTEVELWFTHGGSEYHVERWVRATGDTPSTDKCVLETPDATVEGARDVRRHVEDLLRMDADAFVNCAYVRQGEVNKLINASPSQRQDMLDSLLQLGKLEDYRERASDARVGVGRVLDDKRGALAQLDDQIAEKEDKDLHETLNGLESDLAEVTEDIADKEAQREKAVETRDQAQTVLEEYEEKRERLSELESEIDGKREQIEATEREREELADEISTLQADLADARDSLTETLAATDLDADDPADVEAAAVEQRLADLEAEDEGIQEAIKEASVEKQKHEERASTLREQADELETEATEARADAEELESEIEQTRETITERRAKLETLDETIESLQAEFTELADELAADTDEPVEFGAAESVQEAVASELDEAVERVAQLEADVENQRAAIEEAEALLAEGKCPECGQDVEGAPHVDTIEEDRERLSDLEADLEAARERRDDLRERSERADRLDEIEAEVAQTRTNRENLDQLVTEKAEALADRERQVETLREEASEAETEAAEKRDAAAEHDDEADACRERIGELNGDRGDLKERRGRLETVRDGLDAIAETEDEIAQRREKRDQLESFNDERRETLVDLREQRNDLEDEFDESRVEEARAERDRAAKYLEQVDPHLEQLEARRDELQATVGAVENEIQELESLRERRDDLGERVAWLESLYEEAEQLQGMYGDLRADLRQRNVESLEAMLNEIFELVYQNDSYARIELTGEYELTVYQKDGETLDPEQLSGGERALFNLSLRCAIYRLLAEGIEGAAPMPPLILDEPTVFLDSGHVSQLVELVETMRSYGVEQILVVSHDEELVSAAEDLVRVQKDTRTNRSSVTRETPSEQVLEAD